VSRIAQQRRERNAIVDAYVKPHAAAGRSYAEIAAATGFNRNEIENSVNRLRTSGLVQRKRKPARPTFTVVADIRATDWILKEVEDQHGVSIQKILSRSRAKDVVHARHVAMVRMLDELGMPSTAVGRRMKRDHTVVIYARQKLEARA